MTALPKPLFVSLLLATVTTSPAIAQAGVTRRPAAAPNANTAYAIGSLVGAAAGTHLMGPIDGAKTNVLGAVLGAAIPTIPLLFGRDEPYLPLIGIVLGAPLQALGGAIGDQLARR